MLEPFLLSTALSLATLLEMEVLRIPELVEEVAMVDAIGLFTARNFVD